MATIQYGPAKAAIMHDGEDGEDDGSTTPRSLDTGPVAAALQDVAADTLEEEEEEQLD